MPYPKGLPKSEASKTKVSQSLAKRHYKRRSEILAAGEMECRICKQVKPLDEFVRDKARAIGYVRACKPCHGAITKKWRYANIETAREVERKSHRKKRYEALGISDDEFDQRLIQQAGVCAICKEPQRSGARLAVDHCHNSSEIRGLLCTQCNQGLGYFRDRVDLLRAAIAYLE